MQERFKSFLIGTAPSPALLSPRLSAQLGKEEREPAKERILSRRGGKRPHRVGWPAWASPAQDRDQPEGERRCEGCRAVATCCSDVQVGSQINETNPC